MINKKIVNAIKEHVLEGKKISKKEIRKLYNKYSQFMFHGTGYRCIYDLGKEIKKIQEYPSSWSKSIYGAGIRAVECDNFYIIEETIKGLDLCLFIESFPELKEITKNAYQYEDEIIAIEDIELNNITQHDQSQKFYIIEFNNKYFNKKFLNRNDAELFLSNVHRILRNNDLILNEEINREIIEILQIEQPQGYFDWQFEHELIEFNYKPSLFSNELKNSIAELNLYLDER